MTTNNNQVAAQKPAVPVKRIDLLKNMLNAPSTVKQFQETLSSRAPAFVSSLIELFNSDLNMQECDISTFIKVAHQSAVLNLSINKSLGFAYIIPYKISVKTKDPKTGVETWTKKMTPTFQIGYRGYRQLAMRSNMYRLINADAVYEGEFRRKNKLTGEYDFDGEKTSNNVVGYFAYFQLSNGFSETLYMSLEEVATHAKVYSKSLRKDVTVDTLMSIANMPKSLESKTLGWMGNFDGMAKKTLLRLLLSRSGYLTVELEQAITNDYSDGDFDDSNRADDIKQFDISDIEYEDVTKTNTSQTNQSPEPVAIDEPPY